MDGSYPKIPAPPVYPKIPPPQNWTKNLEVEGSNPARGKNFSPSGAKFHAWGMGVWGGVGARG